MHECSFILPLNDNNGNSLIKLHGELKNQLCRTFGGYTAQEVYGGWLDDNENLIEDNSIKYTVACKEHWLLFNIAKSYATKAKQFAVYFVDYNLEVTIESLEYYGNDQKFMNERLAARKLANGVWGN